MPKFTVTEHKIGTRTWDWGGYEIRSHTLELIGDTDEAGRSHRAILVFDAMIDPDRKGSAVGYMTGDAATGASIVGWFPLESFERFRRLLGEGGAACVHFELRDSDARQGYLRRLGVGRADGVTSAAFHSRPANRATAPAAYAMPL